MTAAQFETQLTAAMTQIHQTFPKTFVNIMTIFNISGVWEVRKDRPYCEVAVPVLHECSCLENNKENLQRMDNLAVAVNAVGIIVAGNTLLHECHIHYVEDLYISIHFHQY